MAEGQPRVENTKVGKLGRLVPRSMNVQGYYRLIARLWLCSNFRCLFCTAHRYFFHASGYFPVGWWCDQLAGSRLPSEYRLCSLPTRRPCLTMSRVASAVFKPGRAWLSVRRSATSPSRPLEKDFIRGFTKGGCLVMIIYCSGESRHLARKHIAQLILRAVTAVDSCIVFSALLGLVEMTRALTKLVWSYS